MKYKAVFIDLDDTLLDTLGNSKAALKHIYSLHKLDEYFDSCELFSETYLDNNYRLWDSYSKGEISKEELSVRRFSNVFNGFDRVTKKHLQQYDTDYIGHIMSYCKQIEEADTILKYLANSYQIVAVSNGSADLQYKKIASAKLDHLFDNVVLPEHAGACKPHRDIFDYALSKIGRQSSEVIMIGDNLLADIGGAQQSGIDQIWYNPQNATLPSEISNPTFIVRRLAEIREIL